MRGRGIGEVAAYRPVSQCNIEELAARQRVIKPSGGVQFARTTDRPEKSEARRMVFDLFRADRWQGPLHMITMPGLHWRFERLLLGDRQPGWTRHPSHHGTYFTSVENDRALFFASALEMPGLRNPGASLKRMRSFPFAETGVKTRFASFMFANVDDFLAAEWRDRLRDRPSTWDAAWLDYTGPLSRDRARAIRRFAENHVTGPLVVTAMKGRWNKDTSAAIAKAGDHSAWLRQCFPGEVLHDIEYHDTAPMAQFAVRLDVRPEPLVDASTESRQP